MVVVWSARNGFAGEEGVKVGWLFCVCVKWEMAGANVAATGNGREEGSANLRLN